jgi:hypothetical protein
MTSMTRKYLMLLSLLLCAGWLLAQEGGMSKSQGQMGKGETGQTKVEGCLQKSAGGFTLTDSTGKMYDLQGETATLSKHVGHEVLITGTKSSASSSMSAEHSEPVLEVTSLKHISKTCKVEGKMSK